MMDLHRKEQGSAGKEDIHYATKPALSLTDRELRNFSDLYSENYGVYSAEAGDRAAERIADMYKRNYCRENYYVAMAYTDTELVGLAFYLRKVYSGQRVITWVVQLVVAQKYRGNRIASTLLKSIWGFSDDFAWGLATTNPCTIQALENATYRKCKPAVIQKHIHELQEVFEDIPFVSLEDVELSDHISRVNSKFFVDYSSVVTQDRVERQQLGDLKPGYEWFAFVFQDQEPDTGIFQKNFMEMVEFSEKKLVEAYRRMPIDEQGWAKGTKNEVDVIQKITNIKKGASVLDIGCGMGRHSLELARRGFHVQGIDFVKEHIQKANEKRQESNLEVQFDVVDIVGKKGMEKLSDHYDMVMALYDVIGSYPETEKNVSVIREAYGRLKKDGYFVLSVMNMELTEKIVDDGNKGSISQNPMLLFKLPPSNIMQKSGNIFNPKHMVVDLETGIVYRKEQFEIEGELSAEYVIRDRRYGKKEIVEILTETGFSIVQAQYVSAGNFDTSLQATNHKAKEIFIVAKKC